MHIGRAIKFTTFLLAKYYQVNIFVHGRPHGWHLKSMKKIRFNFLPHEDFTKEQTAEMKKRVLPYLSQKNSEKGNLVIVAHDDPFELPGYTLNRWAFVMLFSHSVLVSSKFSDLLIPRVGRTNHSI